MCGRFSLATSPEELVAHFRLVAEPAWEPRYNIAPTQDVPIVRPGDAGRRMDLVRWGLVPAGASDLSVGSKMINARCETVARKPSFRWAFEHHRCLVAADGFYEWGRPAGHGRKQPFHFRLADGGPVAFAGLWDRWRSDEAGAVETCTILTTGANDLVRPIHDRMPVILSPAAYDIWLNPVTPWEQVERLWAPYPSAAMICRPVHPMVNTVDRDGPECLDPPPPPVELDLFD